MVRGLPKLFLLISTALVCSLPAQAQDAASAQATIEALQAQARELKATLEEMQAKIDALNKALEETQAKLATAPSPEKLEEEQQLLKAQIEEQHQTKVESDSKYRVKLSGAVLVNLFSNRGAVDSIDIPSFAVPSGGEYSSSSAGGTIRQSLIGFNVFGPEMKGAQVSADIQFDFAGGFANTSDGVTFGLPRIRTGVVRMSWPKTTLVAGQDAPFFSPLSPSSVASIAVPAFSYSGNLWTWTPQFRAEHRFDLTGSNFILQGGVLDALTGEVPTSQFLRTPEAGESSGRPAYASRMAWSKEGGDHPLEIGGGVYYNRQNWGFQRNIDGWAATSDWNIPLPARFELSGEFYRGRAIGGLGGGLGRTVLLSGAVTDPATLVRGLAAVGGWSQLKFRQTSKLEWNAAVGQDDVPADDLHYFPQSTLNSTYYSYLARNQSGLLNFIYKPRSDILFSTEYRRIRTFSMSGNLLQAGHLNLGMGVLF